MTYQINFTDSVNKGAITVQDRTINTETSLGLPGKDSSGYGETVLENFLHLMENFASNDSPRNPVEGQLWYDTTTGIDQLKIYDGTNWISASGFKKGNIEPDVALSTLGDLWVNTSTQQVYIYTGSGWLLVGPEFSDGVTTGSKFENIISSDNQLVPVVITYSNSVPVMIVSSIEFIPKATVSGFSKIYVGINLNSNISGYPAKYRGIAEKAESLVYGSVTIPADTVVRRNVENVLSKALRIRNNSGLDIGDSQTILLYVEGNAGVLSHKATGSNFDIRVNNAGVMQTAIRAKSDGKVGIGVLAPTESLDVLGNIRASNKVIVNSVDNSLSIGTGALVVAGGVGIARDLNVGGKLDISDVFKSHSIMPADNNQYDIGTAVLKFNKIYATNLYGTLNGNITGNAAGSSGSAAKLNSSTTFRMIGDVTSQSFTFDGQVGGTVKTFNTSIDPDFVSGKPLVTDVIGSDEVMVNRVGVGLVKMTQSKLVSSVPTIPVGSMMQYGGKVAPPGWFICDGSEVNLATYSALATALGYSLADLASWGWGVTSTPTLTFFIPDMRGRFALGHLGTATTGNRVTSLEATIVGNYGGVESTYLTKDQLPEHQHSLVGDSGTQFYATSPTPGATDSNSNSYYGVGEGEGSGLQITSGVDDVVHTTQLINGSMQDVGNRLSLVNPFATINFIIYHGVI